MSASAWAWRGERPQPARWQQEAVKGNTARQIRWGQPLAARNRGWKKEKEKKRKVTLSGGVRWPILTASECRQVGTRGQWDRRNPFRYSTVLSLLHKCQTSSHSPHTDRFKCTKNVLTSDQCKSKTNLRLHPTSRVYVDKAEDEFISDRYKFTDDQ